MTDKTDFVSVLKHWKHISGYSGRKVINHELSLTVDTPKIVKYSIPTDPKFRLKGKSILFFADIHYTTDGDLYFPELVEKTKPDWIVFGGDLISYACFIEGALEWLRKSFGDFPDIPKFVVPGNWDRRRRSWFPLKNWYEKYDKAGFELLANEERVFDGISFYGLDDSRFGNPVLNSENFRSDSFNCILSHSVVPVVDNVTGHEIPGESLVLCGHSHAGQIRIPLFGALFTSTRFWKLFEYGLYRYRNSNLQLIMTSGLGTSRIPIRLFCQPEVVIIRFD